MTVGEALNQASSRGKIFRVTFIKRTDGQRRVMVCRRGVKKGVKGVGLAFEPSAKGLISVWDCQARDFRFIPAEGIVEVAGAGQLWRVTGKEV